MAWTVESSPLPARSQEERAASMTLLTLRGISSGPSVPLLVVKSLNGAEIRSLHSSSKRLSRAVKQIAFAFDIDGVLKQGSDVLPQAKRTLQYLAGTTGRLRRPIPYLLMTNGGGVTEADRLNALSADFGVKLSENQLVQSHTPLRDYVEEYANQPVLVIGGLGDAGRRVAESYGLKQAYILQDLIAWRPTLWDRYRLREEEASFVKRDVDFLTVPIRAIFVINDNGLDWGLAIQVITELLSSEGGILGTQREGGTGDEDRLPLFMTNPDVVWKSQYKLPRLGMGAFRLALEAVYKSTTGLHLPYKEFGKPHVATYEFAERMLRRHLAELGGDPQADLRVYMVGDNPESDIAGANAHGWSSILVRTGVFKDGQKISVRPDTIVDDVEKAVEWAIDREGGVF